MLASIVSSPLSHIPVLQQQVVDALAPQPGETYADCTAGLGGHAALIASRIGNPEHSGTILLNDADASNLVRAVDHVKSVSSDRAKVLSFQGNFADLPHKLTQAHLAADMVLADLGFASNQVDDASRGFSFMREGPLDMRLDPSRPLSAADLVNKGRESELTSILQDFGEERAARRIIAAILRARRTAPITTTTALADLIKSTIGHRPGANHPATKTFQALRIAVNDELGSLEAMLASIRRAAEQLHDAPEDPTWLRPGARIAFITFHSLEDRPVKRVFAELVERALAVPVGHGICTAHDEEIASNPRARSAKLRAIRLLPPTMPK